MGKREIMKRLAEENSELQNAIAFLNRQILAVETENAVLSEQLSFFVVQSQGSPQAGGQSDPSVGAPEDLTAPSG
jgi:hypothetical protein